MKLSSVTSSVLTKSGREMIDALIAGQRDPEVLAEMAKGRMRAAIPELKDALARRFNAHHGLLCEAMLVRIDQADATIDELTARIEVLLDPHEAAVSLMVGIPGVSYRSAQVILAEIGTDMSRFPTAGHFASWAGMCPGNNESAGKHRSGRTRHGSKWLGIALVEAAHGAGRSKDTYLGSQYARIRGRGERGVLRWPLDPPSWSSSGICSPPERPTTTWAATTSTSAAPAPPTSVHSSLNSKPWATKSPSNPQPGPHTTRHSGLRPERGLPPPLPLRGSRLVAAGDSHLSGCVANPRTVRRVSQHDQRGRRSRMVSTGEVLRRRKPAGIACSASSAHVSAVQVVGELRGV